MGAWVTMADAMRKPVHLKPPVSLGMYRSSYKRDYRWCEENQPTSEVYTQKLKFADSQLKAKEFSVPEEPRVMTYCDNIGGEGRGVTPGPAAVRGRKQVGSASSPQAFQQAQEEQRKRFDSALPLAESYLPRPYPAAELTATRAERLERPQALSELENELPSSQCLLAAARAPGAAGMLRRRQKLDPGWGTYQHFMLETGRAKQLEAQQNKNMLLGSSVLVEECFDLDRRSTYTTDFQRWPAAHDGCCKANKNLSHVFPEDEHFQQNHWVSEYKDNYSIFLHRLNRAAQEPTTGLCSALKPRRLSSQTGIALGTAP
nr:uncharacterized protein LOC106033904 [Anser cygnoides]